MAPLAHLKPKAFLSIVSIVVPVVFLIGFVIMGADIVYLNLRPLERLRVRFPALLSYAHFLAPAVAALVWLSLRWRFPYLSALVAVLLCVFMLNGVVWYAESRVDRIATTRFLTPEEQEAVVTLLTFPVWQHAVSGRGYEILIEKSSSHVQQLTEKLRRLDVLRPARQNPPAALE